MMNVAITFAVTVELLKSPASRRRKQSAILDHDIGADNGCEESSLIVFSCVSSLHAVY